MRNLASTTLQKCITTVMSFISAHTKNLDTKPVSTEEKKSASAAVTVASNVSADVESTMPSQGVDVQRYIHSETPVVSEKDDPKIEMEDVTEEKGMESITEERATDNNTDNAENKEDITGEKEDITGEREDITANKEDTTNEKSPTPSSFSSAHPIVCSPQAHSPPQTGSQYCSFSSLTHRTRFS